MSYSCNYIVVVYYVWGMKLCIATALSGSMCSYDLLMYGICTMLVQWEHIILLCVLGITLGVV
jgi:hypothetical protein